MQLHNACQREIFRSARTARRGCARRGAVLFEILVALAIFVAAGLLTMQVMQNAYRSILDTGDRQLAVDIARSKMAELEAGIIDITRMRSDIIMELGSIESIIDESRPGGVPDEELWRLEVDTQRSEYDGLTLVILHVVRGFDDNELRVTLRQLMRLREGPVEEFEQDEMMDGLMGVRR